MRQAGKSLYEIADDLGLRSAADVNQLLAERFDYDASYLTESERSSLLAMEVARLDALQAAHWESAMMGDIGSARFVLDTIRTRVKITGLETIDPVVQKNLVLVMGEAESDYIAALKAADSD